MEESSQLALDSEGNIIASCRSAGLLGEEMAVLKYGQSAAPEIESTTVAMRPPNSAMIKVLVNPNGAATAVSLGHGVTPELGSETEALSVSVGDVAVVSEFEISVIPHTTYHFLAKASNSKGEAQGVPVTFTVPNQPPALKSDEAMLQSGDFVVNVLGNDADLDGDPLTVTSAGGAEFGTVVSSPQGVTYSAGPNFSVFDKFTYTVIDGFGGTAIGGVTVFASPMDRWRYEKFDQDARNLGISGDQADPDVDGFNNLLEYASGSSPTRADEVAPVVSIVENRIHLKFFRNVHGSDLIYTVQASGDLQNWLNVAANQAGHSLSSLTSGIIVKETLQGDRLLVEVEDALPVFSSERRFFRVTISR